MTDPTGLAGLAGDWGEWLLLHRARQDELRLREGGYLLGEQPVTGHLAAVLDALVDGGLLTVDAPEPGGTQRVRVTDLGQARYSALRHTRPHGTPTGDPGFTHLIPGDRPGACRVTRTQGKYP